MSTLAVIWTFEIFAEYEFDFQIELLKYDLKAIKQYKEDFDFYMCILPEQKDLYKPYIEDFPCEIHYYDLNLPDWVQIVYDIDKWTRPLIMPAIIPFDLLHKYDMVLNIQADNYIRNLNFDMSDDTCDLSAIWYLPREQVEFIAGGCILFYKKYLRQLENVKQKIKALKNNPRYFFEELLLGELCREEKLDIRNPAALDSICMNQRTLDIFYKNTKLDQGSIWNALTCLEGFLKDLRHNKIILRWAKERFTQLCINSSNNNHIFKDKDRDLYKKYLFIRSIIH